LSCEFFDPFAKNIMPRPKYEHPTPAELEVLQLLWDQGPLTVREVMEALNRRRHRAYTSVMSLLGVMADKHLLKRRLKGRAFVYEARVAREGTVGQMLRDLLGRAFDGSAPSLVARLLDESSPSAEELAEIRNVIDQFRQGKKGE
jgi:BlaI family transcriptional regulator, penicillinase repressor